MRLSLRSLIMALLMVGVTISLAVPAAAVDGDGDGIDDSLDDCQFAGFPVSNKIAIFLPFTGNQCLDRKLAEVVNHR